MAGWDEVLGLEGVPDSDCSLLVHTSGQGCLLLQGVDLEEIVPVLHHYVARFAEMQRRSAHADKTGVFIFKAQAFSWPRFMAWIATGYVLAGAMTIAMLVPDSGHDPLTTLLVAAAVGMATAGLVWAIPVGQVSHFSSTRMRAFEFDGVRHVLLSADSRWRVDLATASWEANRRRGIGYALNFISFRPRRGPRLDVLVNEADLALLVSRLTGCHEPARSGLSMSERGSGERQ